MATNLDVCCRGRLAATDTDGLTRESVWEACHDGIQEAIEEQLQSDRTRAIVIDGLPTIGKTRNATDVVFDLGEPAAILTHRYETRDDHVQIAAESGRDVVEVPTLDRDCPTRQGEFGDHWAEQIHDYRTRGASPTYLHYHMQDALPCMRDGDCPYLEKWEAVEQADVIVGGPVHAAIDRVITDRIVIFDEDPGTAFRTEFDANSLSQALSAYLGNTDDIPIDNEWGLKGVATNESMADIRDDIRNQLSQMGTVRSPAEAIGEENGHAEAPAAVLGLLELGGPILDADLESYDWDDRLRREAELGYDELPDGAQIVYDYAESRLYLRRPPSLEKSKAVVGLDGTPVREIWQGRLGIEDVELRRILCDDCRAEYLLDVVGYTFIQTSDAVKPYSSGEWVNRRSDYGLIEAVASRHDEPPGVITTKRAEEMLFNQDPDEPNIDRFRVVAKIGDVQHYGALRSSNLFQGVGVGIVLGSPHPGDRAIQITAAMEGHVAVRDEETKGANLDYTIPEKPFLQHYRENKVAQAVLRFGRDTPATVYIHTGMVPDWLGDMVAIGPDSVGISERSEGQRAVIHSLLGEGPGTAIEISNRPDLPIGEKQTRDWLKRLRKEGYVKRDDTQPYTWQSDGLEEAPHTARVRIPD